MIYTKITVDRRFDIRLLLQIQIICCYYVAHQFPLLRSTGTFKVHKSMLGAVIGNAHVTEAAGKDISGASFP